VLFDLPCFSNGFAPMATTFRALVMLAALVGLPAAWIYYGPLPPDAQRVVDRLVGVAKEAIGRDTTSTASAGPGRAQSMNDAAAPAWDAAASGGTSARLELPAAAPVEAAPLAATKAPTLAERVEPLLAKLRQFGVVAYDLEPWGTGGKLYRFHCEMPLAESAQLTQQFEAFAEDPQATVEQVVAQVAQWQTANQRAGL
jgi:hypothetical protein